MNFWELLYDAAKTAGVPTTKIGPNVGLSRTYVSACKAQNQTPGLYTAARLLGGCGYALVALPLDDVPDGALVVDSSGQGEG